VSCYKRVIKKNTTHSQKRQQNGTGKNRSERMVVRSHNIVGPHFVQSTVLISCTNSPNYNIYLLCCWRFGNRCWLLRNDHLAGVAEADRK